MAVKHVASAAEMRKLIAIPTLSVVDFFATWCGPCKAIAPQVHDIAMRNPNINFLSVDVDKVGEAAQDYNIRAMPTFAFFRAGQEVERFEGADVRRLEDAIRRLGVAPKPTIPDDATLQSMSAKQLLTLLAQLSVSTHGMVEKSELVNALKAQRR